MAQGARRNPPSEAVIHMLRRGVSQRELARHFGLAECTISLLLSGKLVLEPRLDQIAAYLNISRARLDRLIRANGSTSSPHGGNDGRRAA